MRLASWGKPGQCYAAGGLDSAKTDRILTGKE